MLRVLNLSQTVSPHDKGKEISGVLRPLVFSKTESASRHSFYPFLWLDLALQCVCDPVGS